MIFNISLCSSLCPLARDEMPLLNVFHNQELVIEKRRMWRLSRDQSLLNEEDNKENQHIYLSTPKGNLHQKKKIKNVGSICTF